MGEERTFNFSTEDSSQTRQRKKRKWDQPAEPLVSAGFTAVPGIVPLMGGALGSLGGVTVSGALPLAGGVLSMNQLAANCSNVPLMIQAPLVQQHANALVQKLNIPKIQDELIIAREIIINDAEPSVRYKLTKRQTQEEIQRSTGAVVITRGKYHPPSAPPDSEKLLYLHISAGANLKDTAERILAVDRAAAMVEEMLKPGQNLQAGTHALSTCVFLGFDPDPSLNIAARIRGPSDQYINHIMNETGVNVILRGFGSGNIGNLHVEGEEKLHLFLSGNDPKGLEAAKLLAENLLDTIRVECGVTRVSASKVYSAVPPPQQVYTTVPPPQQLVAGVVNSGSNVKASPTATASLASSAVAVSPLPSITSSAGYTQPLSSGGTSYSGYGGIYPQATPLQQVALALRQSSSPISSATPVTSSAEPKMSFSSSSEKEKQPPQKRKFKELPAVSKGAAKPIQVSESRRPNGQSADLDVRNVSTMPAPKKLPAPTSNEMPPPPPKTMAPPLKYTSSSSPSSPAVKGQNKNNNTLMNKAKSDCVPDTLVKLMEYGDDDDDDDDPDEETIASNSAAVRARKPFWAL